MIAFLFLVIRRQPCSSLFPYTTLFRSNAGFLPVILRNGGGTPLVGLKALHFGRSPLGPGNSASLLWKVRPRDPLFLRCIGMWRDLLCPRSTGDSGICFGVDFGRLD